MLPAGAVILLVLFFIFSSVPICTFFCHKFSHFVGVFDGCDQTNPDIDHVVQLVGAGTDPNYGNYWLVRYSSLPFYFMFNI